MACIQENLITRSVILSELNAVSEWNSVLFVFEDMFKVINISVLTHDSNNINHLINDAMDAYDEPQSPG